MLMNSLHHSNSRFSLFCLLKVLIQGCLVTKENLHYVLELIHEQLVNLEDVLAKQTACSFVGETQSQVCKDFSTVSLTVTCKYKY